MTRMTKAGAYLVVSLTACCLLAADRPAANDAARIGAAAAAFTLKDQNGKTRSLDQYKGKILVLEWTNPNCPFVQRHYHNKTMVNLYNQYHGRGVEWLAINSTDGSTVAEDQSWAKTNRMPYPLLDDHTGKVGKAYGAKTTPDMFIINKDGKLVYEGAIDNDPDGDKQTGRVNYVARALDELLSGKHVSTPQTKSYGCHVAYGD